MVSTKAHGVSFVVMLVVMTQRNSAFQTVNSVNRTISENVLESETKENFCPLGTKEQMTLCKKEFDQVASMGYPWSDSPWGMSGGEREPIKDPLSNLDHICRLFHRFYRCIRLHRISDYCLMEGSNPKLSLKITFDFICNVTPRKVNTVRSLECLKHTRVMSLLDVYMGKYCVDGPEILDNKMKVFKTAAFYVLQLPKDSFRYLGPPDIVSDLCLPTTVIHGCVKQIVKKACGQLTGDLVVNFIEFHNKVQMPCYRSDYPLYSVTLMKF